MLIAGAWCRRLVPDAGVDADGWCADADVDMTANVLAFRKLQAIRISPPTPASTRRFSFSCVRPPGLARSATVCWWICFHPVFFRCFPSFSRLVTLVRLLSRRVITVMWRRGAADFGHENWRPLQNRNECVTWGTLTTRPGRSGTDADWR